MNISQADRDAIRDTIAAQLEAFQADDGSQAFLYATPEIRQQFKTVANFMQMVKTAYAPVYRPRGVLFGSLDEMQGTPAQSVFFMGATGEVVQAMYLMQQTPAGDWRIAGCFLVPMDEILDVEE
jgi:hypothetical protein